MKEYTTENIRNVAVLGHGSDGKTTLVESLLFVTGTIDRQGRVEDGNTVSDYDAEEKRRQISISASVAPLEYQEKKINLIDVPGFFDFAGELVGPLAVCEGAIGNLENALADYTVCIDNGYELTQSYYQRAQIYAALGDTENQNKDLAESLKYSE